MFVILHQFYIYQVHNIHVDTLFMLIKQSNLFDSVSPSPFINRASQFLSANITFFFDKGFFLVFPGCFYFNFIFFFLGLI